jgi:hypothetical protein
MRKRIIAGLAAIAAITGAVAPAVVTAAPAQAAVSHSTHYKN